jgi:glycosyltransferase involved in cell wall biosynthesis
MIKINCFCTGTTFPNGEATNSRIIMIGKALQLKNAQFIIHLNSEGNKNSLNDQLEGSLDGLKFIHLNKSMTVGLPRWSRMFNYFGAGFYNTLLILKKISREKNQIIYLYSHGSIFNVWVSVLARLFNVPVVQEVNEWAGDIDQRIVYGFIYKKVMFKWAKGALVISDNIERQVLLNKQLNKNLKTLTLPVLADGTDWKRHPKAIDKTFLWCGLIEGYFRDVIFIINAFSKIHNEYPAYKLIICGKHKPETSERISELLKSLNVPLEKLILTGFVTNESLVQYCQSATALISPLWNDQTSMARFPTKIASFLFSGRPVLTCQVGEVGKHLQDNKTALFFGQSDENDLADKMKKVIVDPNLAATIGMQGMALAYDKFDYRVYADELFGFFDSLTSTK